MSGYNYEAGMSNNAMQAYQEGRKPLSKITAADLSAAGWAEGRRFALLLAKNNFWRPAEWHHSGGGWYNRVDFFDPADLVASWNAASEEDKQMYRLLLAPGNIMPAEIAVEGYYATFGGSRRRPKFLGNVSFEGIKRGDWIYLPDGSKKRASGKNIFWTEKI